MADVLKTYPIDTPDREDEDEGTVLSTEEARSGETSGHVRIILASSLALAAVAWVIVDLFY